MAAITFIAFEFFFFDRLLTLELAEFRVIQKDLF